MNNEKKPKMIFKKDKYLGKIVSEGIQFFAMSNDDKDDSHLYPYYEKNGEFFRTGTAPRLTEAEIIKNLKAQYAHRDFVSR